MSRAWSRRTPDALFVGSAVGNPSCVVVIGAAGFTGVAGVPGAGVARVPGAGVGAVALVAVFIPGAVAARISVIAA